MKNKKDNLIECGFCGKKGSWINVLVDSQITKKDGSDIILCNECLNHYANHEYDKIKLKTKMSEEAVEDYTDGDRLHCVKCDRFVTNLNSDKLCPECEEK